MRCVLLCAAAVVQTRYLHQDVEDVRTRRDPLLCRERLALYKHGEVLQEFPLALCQPPDMGKEVVRDEISYVAAELPREALIDQRIV